MLIKPVLCPTAEPLLQINETNNELEGTNKFINKAAVAVVNQKEKLQTLIVAADGPRFMQNRRKKQLQ